MTARTIPILFSAEMVRAILDGRKTQTRRVLKPQPVGRPWFWDGDDVDPVPRWYDGWESGALSCGGAEREVNQPLRGLSWAPGDTLWVRETWQFRDWTDDGDPWVRYQSDEAVELCKPPEEWRDRADNVWAALSNPDGPARDKRWRSSIHMPRWAARIFLRVTDVRVQRLQEISEADARAEGAIQMTMDDDGKFYAADSSGDYRTGFAGLWEHINGKRHPWDSDPWVAAIMFERIKP